MITRFLDARAGGRLYPEPPRLWETLTLEATADGIAEAALLMVYEDRLRPEDARSAAWVEAQWGKVARALDAVEARWIAHLAGPLDCGQIALGCALGYLDFRHADRAWRGGAAGLAGLGGALSRPPGHARDAAGLTAPIVSSSRPDNLGPPAGGEFAFVHSGLRNGVVHAYGA